MKQRIANVTRRAKKRRVRRSSEKRSVDRMTEETGSLREAEVAKRNSVEFSFS